MHAQQLQYIIDNTLDQNINIAETVLITDLDAINLKNKVIHSTADPVFQVQGRHWSVANGKIRCMVGVGFEIVASANGLLSNVYCAGLMKSKELFRCVGMNSCYDTHIIGGEWEKPQGMTVPIISVSVSGPFFNANTFRCLRLQTNGAPQAPCVLLSCTHSANWIYGNSFYDINFEVPNAGAIHLNSAFSTIIQNAQIFDADLYGNVTGPLIKIGRLSTNHLKSKMTKILGYYRLSGIANPGIYDIDIPTSGHYGDSLSLDMIGGIAGALVQVRVTDPSAVSRGIIDCAVTYA